MKIIDFHPVYVKALLRLYLESDSSLDAALAHYESAGFVHTTPPPLSEYERADVYMIYHQS